MPRPKPPPTPTGSSDLKALENLKAFQTSEMESIFTLPPPAIRSTDAHSQTPSNGKSSHTRDATNSTAPSQSTPPVSPQDKPLAASPRHKRTSSGVVKAAVESAAANGGANTSYALPPPPSRARKIIQMKPKSQTTNNSSPASDASYVPPASAATSTTSPPNKASTAASAASNTTTNSKRKQPSATSAAGRKIARKTAHSIIERRRRSKMNEEFGVLKDMIPACEGVEMHKLAILQAGIEYVRYLEGCVAQLKDENAKLGGRMRSSTSSRMQLDDPPGEDEDLDDEDEDDQDEDEDEDGAVDVVTTTIPAAPPARGRSSRPSTVAGSEWTLRDSRKSSVASLSGSSTYPSPHIHSQSQGAMDEAGNLKKRPLLPAGVQSFTASPSITVHSGGMVSSATPTPTLLSPAFNSIHFSPDLARTQTNSSVGKSGSGVLNTPTSSWASVNPSGGSSGSMSNPSPNLQPLPSPKAAMNLPLPHPAVASLQLPPHYNASIQREREAGSSSPGALSDGSGTAEATASAALMMLTNEWRGGGRTEAQSSVTASTVGRMRDSSKDRGKGMSVRDLLSS
ncbi:hypothetical protein Z517_01173 [Fonsecaea pedrosoi CBS 271.37]|uniref:Unplaced genomic scaffold supercont1.1, whole genome shotgun sequence n=1 Tax=Fonsecaea pedrosoi CBS 271.37 TaxID=1442368 RepID=A0A0D2E6P5_9EURO|nr:uncharacterized protein Z517_01173 [Fonsecaea pedrosoi CBS 271.37]KIW85781.1 hypothetical protein Z517_01173 [Fonsecaea pedrosoi CBS 271.37]